MVYFDMSKRLESHSVEAFGKAAATGKEVDECVMFLGHRLFYNHIFIRIIQLICNNSIVWSLLFQ